MTSTTRQIWEWLGSPAWEPPVPKRGQQFADSLCFLCGDDTEGRGWPRDTWLTPTFTNQTLAAAPSATAICQPCAYLGSGDAWRAYCAAHPEMNLKSMSPLSWRSYSHVFAPGFHVCPARNEWRRWLLEPPDPPFVFVLSETGQKHLIYLSRVSTSRDRYWVQVEDDRVLVTRTDMARVLELFEALLALGFTREEVRTGNYSQGRLGKAGLAYRDLEAAIAEFRRSDPQLLRIAVTAAHGPNREGK